MKSLTMTQTITMLTMKLTITTLKAVITMDQVTSIDGSMLLSHTTSILRSTSPMSTASKSIISNVTMEIMRGLPTMTAALRLLTSTWERSKKQVNQRLSNLLMLHPRQLQVKLNQLLLRKLHLKSQSPQNLRKRSQHQPQQLR